MEYFLTILYSIFFSYLIFKLKFFRIDNFPKRYMILAFLAKVFAGIILIYIYTAYYKTRVSADIFKYYDDGKVIFSALHKHPLDYLRMVTGIGSDAEHLKHYYTTCNFWYKDFNYNLYNDNRTVIRFNAIAMLFSNGGSLIVHTVFMSFISFIGLTSIFKVFVKYLTNKKLLLYLGIFYVPSILLWTSGVIKEGILIFAFGQMLYHLIKILEKGVKNYSSLWLLISIYILLISKFYVFVAVIPSIIAVVWIYKTKFKRIYLKFAITYFLFLILGFNTQRITPKYNATEIIATKQHDFYNFIDTLKNVGSRYEIPRLQPTAISIIKNSPLAVYNAFVQPTPKRINSLIMIPAAIENYIFIILLLISIIFSSYKKIKNKTLFWFSVIFVFNLYVISGLTTPVIGALVRYKVPAIPFLVVIILSLIDFDKVKRILIKKH